MANERLFFLGVKAFLQNKHGNYLLIQPMGRDGKRYYDLPGGRVNEGENQVETLKREVIEEAGISDVVIVKHLGLFQTDLSVTKEEKNFGLIFSFYQCSTSQEKLSFEEDIIGEWVPLNKVIETMPGLIPDEISEMLS